MQITLRPETEAHTLEAAQEEGMDAEEWLLSLLEKRDADAASVWWSSLGPQEQEDEARKTQESVSATRQGHSRPANEVFGG